MMLYSKTSRGAWMMMRDITRFFGGDVDDFGFASWRSQSDFPANRVAGNFSYLKSRGHLVERGGDRYGFSESAKIKLLAELATARSRDGKIRVVIFDIPEKMRKSRDIFRVHMKELGFKMMQRSVWVSELACEDLVKLLVDYYGVGKYTKLVVGEDIRI